MERELFESFYTGNIEVIAKKVCEAHNEFVYRENLEGVFEEYLNQRSLLRVLLKSETSPNSDLSGERFIKENELLLDGHKVSACITASIIKVRIIGNRQVDDSASSPYNLTNSSRMNEQVALFSGISCLLEFMADNEESLRLPTEDLIALRFPKTDYEGRSTYLDSLVRALYYTSVLNGVNTLLLAHIFFLIEKYHRQSIELAKVNSDAGNALNDIETTIVGDSQTAQ